MFIFKTCSDQILAKLLNLGGGGGGGGGVGGWGGALFSTRGGHLSKASALLTNFIWHLLERSRGINMKESKLSSKRCAIATTHLPHFNGLLQNF